MDKKIFLIEDDDNLRRGISFSLSQEGYEVEINDRIQGSLPLIKEKKPDLIILDVNLPDGNGFDLCKEIRRFTSTPIFFLTALDMETDVITGLSIGGDDYITKPFSLAILKAKIALILNRFETQAKEIKLNDFKLNLDSQRLFQNGSEVPLSSTEFRIVSYLMKNAGIVIEKELLLETLWDDKGRFVDENTLSVNIRRIRIKIEKNPKNPENIKTVRGVGYIWEKR